MLRAKSLLILVIVVVSLLTNLCFADDSDSILVIFDGSGITGGTGWVDDGTAVRLATDTDSVGIGTTTPVEKLDVNGRIKMSQQTAPSTTTDKLYNTGGNLYWNGAQLTGGGGILPTGTSGQTLRHSGSGWSAVDNLYNDGTNIGIGTTNPVNAKLEIQNSDRCIFAYSSGNPYAVIDGRVSSATSYAGFFHNNSTGGGIYGYSNNGKGITGDSYYGIGGYFSTGVGYGLIVGSGNVGNRDNNSRSKIRCQWNDKSYRTNYTNFRFRY